MFTQKLRGPNLAKKMTADQHGEPGKIGGWKHGFHSAYSRMQSDHPVHSQATFADEGLQATGIALDLAAINNSPLAMEGGPKFSMGIYWYVGNSKATNGG